jgi:hypothetical protein
MSPPAISLQCDFTIASNQNSDAALFALQAMIQSSALSAESAISKIFVVGVAPQPSGQGTQAIVVLIGSASTTAATLMAGAASLIALFDVSTFSAGYSRCSSLGITANLTVAVGPGGVASPSAALSPPALAPLLLAQPPLNVTAVQLVSNISAWGGISALANATARPQPFTSDYDIEAAKARQRRGTQTATDKRYTIAVVCTLPFTLCPYRLKREYAVLLLAVFAAVAFTVYHDTLLMPPPPASPSSSGATSQPWNPVVVSVYASPRTPSGTVPAGVTVTLQAVLNSSAADTAGAMWNQLDGVPVHFSSALQPFSPSPGSPALVAGRLSTTLTFPPGALIPGQQYTFQCLAADFFGSTAAGSGLISFQVDNSGVAAASSAAGGASLTVSSGVSPWTVTVQPAVAGALYSLTASLQGASRNVTGDGLSFAVFTPQVSPTFVVSVPSGAASVTFKAVIADSAGRWASASSVVSGGFALPGNNAGDFTSAMVAQVGLLLAQPDAYQARMLMTTLATIALQQNSVSLSGRRRHLSAVMNGTCDVCISIANATSAAPPEQALLLALWGALALPQGAASFASAAAAVLPAALRAASTAAAQVALDLLSVTANISGAAPAAEVLARTISTTMLDVATSHANTTSLTSIASIVALNSTNAALLVRCDADATLSRLKMSLPFATGSRTNFSCYVPDATTVSPTLNSGACVACLGVSADSLFGGVQVMQTAYTRLQATAVSGPAPTAIYSSVPAPVAAVFLTDGPAGGAACSSPGNSSGACATLPSVIPGGHWVDFNTSDPWNPSWYLSGPLTAGCTRIILNCTSSAANLYAFLGESQLAPPRVYLSPDGNPFAEPALMCTPNLAANATNVTRFGSSNEALAFYGDACELWRPDNAYGCYWDAPSQQFKGPRCVATSPGLTCMCAQSPVALMQNSMPAVFQLVQPQDIGTPTPRQVPLVLIQLAAGGCLIVMMCLFCIAYIVARRTDRAGVGHLCVAEVGFCTSAEGAWMWALHGPGDGIDDHPASPSQGRAQAPRLARPHGSAVAIADAIGLPLVRLRSAIPDCLWPTGTLAAVLGRPSGLSSDALQATARAHSAVLRGLLRACFRPGAWFCRTDAHGKGPASDPGTSTPPSTSSLAEMELGGASLPALFTGTALMYAHIAVSSFMTPDELANHEAASAAALSKLGIAKLGRWTLRDLRRALYTMLSANSSLRAAACTRWQDAARSWCLVLSQRSDGSWDPDQSFAAVMRARAAEVESEFADVSGELTSRPSAPCPVTFSVEALLAAAPRGLRQRHARQMHGLRTDGWVTDLVTGAAPAPAPVEQHTKVVMPRIPAFAAAPPQRALSSLSLATEDGQTSRALRTWCTLLAMEFLTRTPSLPVSRSGTTPLDRAYRYLERRRFFPSSEAWEFAARQALDSWEEAQKEAEKGALRSRHVRLSTLHRWFVTAAVGVVQCTRTHHDLLSSVLAPRGGVLTRPQRAMMATTAFLAPMAGTAFLLNLRARSCCNEVHSLVGCSTDPQVPCRGVVGITCAQLAQVLATVQDTGLSQYTCHRFPDPGNASDAVVMGTLVSGFSAAVAWSVRTTIMAVNRYANDEIHGGAVVVSQPSGMTRLIARLRAPDGGARFHQRLWRAAQQASTVEKKLVESMMSFSALERSSLLLARLAAAPSLGWQLLMRRLRYRGESYRAVADLRAVIPAGPWVVFIWMGVIAGLLFCLSDIRWYEGEAALVAYVVSCFVSFAVDMFMELRDMYQELFQSLVIYVGLEMTGLRSAEDTWAEVLNFLSLQALLLPTAGQGYVPPPSLVEQVATVYRMSRSVDDL